MSYFEPESTLTYSSQVSYGIAFYQKHEDSFEIIGSIKEAAI